MKTRRTLFLLLLTAAFSAGAFADGQSIYKWTDAQGVLHYSDKPPKDVAADLQTLNLPPLPPQDPAKIAAAQAAQAAATAATLKVLQAETLLQQQQLALAAQQAELQAAQDAQQQTPTADDTDLGPAVYPIYLSSPFIPRRFRRNLYVPHHFQGHPKVPASHSMPGTAPAPVAGKI